MGNRVKIECVNCAKTVEVEMGTSLVELVGHLGLKGRYPLLLGWSSSTSRTSQAFESINAR